MHKHRVFYGGVINAIGCSFGMEIHTRNVRMFLEQKHVFVLNAHAPPAGLHSEYERVRSACTLHMHVQHLNEHLYNGINDRMDVGHI